eukprot:TRINITY_DN3217_c0_g1_i3.p1 TRINITY_DN3217_c0_g1~~TRINITY_DN3217_c0_g1_i3.p1  ORF type:complete len:589 (-),score=139.79 TRINITY_DN3217_c0_g1_i3:12-1778(-)
MILETSEAVAEGFQFPLWLLLLAAVLCVVGGGIAAGLTIGLMSLDKVGLEILIEAGDPVEAAYARKILPVRSKGNLLLCTLLLTNTAFNEALPLIIDRMPGAPPVVAFLLPTITVMIFGEIIPQSFCTRYGLSVGAKLIWLVKILRLIFLPVAYPMAWLLDRILGEELGNIYTHRELAGLIDLHSQKKYGDLTEVETTILKGTLAFTRKTAGDIYVPLEQVFMLDLNERFDQATVNKVWQSGRSRIPVYEHTRTNILGLLVTKDLITLRSEDELSVRTVFSFYGFPLLRIFSDHRLDTLFGEFRGGRGHMALVQSVNSDGDGDPYYEVCGIVTLEDVMEELMQMKIFDETDIPDSPPSGGLMISGDSVMKNTGRMNISMFKQRHQMGNPTRLLPDQVKAVVSYLGKVVKEFRPLVLHEAALINLITRHAVATEVTPDTLRPGGTAGEEGMVYTRGSEGNFFCLILTGKMEVLAGQEGIRCEMGPWSYLGVPSLSTPSFIPDITARVLVPSYIVCISGQAYRDALRTQKYAPTDTETHSIPSAILTTTTTISTPFVPTPPTLDTDDKDSEIDSAPLMARQRKRSDESDI